MKISWYFVKPIYLTIILTTALSIQYSYADSDVPRDVMTQQKEQIFKKYIDDLYDKKSVVKSFTDANGKITDCVPITEQPSLKNSGLKSSDIPRQPAILPVDLYPPLLKESVILKSAAISNSNEPSCPQDTVPIIRLTMDVLKNFDSVADFHKKFPKGKPFVTNQNMNKAYYVAPHYYGVAYQYINNIGAESYISIWNPTLESRKDFSLSQIWVSAGDQSTQNFQNLEVGWQKYPDLYGDNNPHFFIYSTADNYNQTGCYNLCNEKNGFVVTNPAKSFIGKALGPSSVINGNQYAMQVMWYREPKTGHWWLQHNGNWIGYYPTSRFSAAGLKYKSSIIDFGGEVVDATNDGRKTSTDMGSGIAPNSTADFGKVAYQRRLKYIDNSGYLRDITSMGINFTAGCYASKFGSDLANDNKRYFLLFGGTGYNGTTCR